MGQKTHPYAFRIGIVNDWKSRWFSDKEYTKLFDEADILLLPYRLKSYQTRGSGVVADGVLADKIFVYTEGIGMENFLKYGNGLPSNSSTNCAENIMKIVLNFESFNTQTYTARNE